MKMNGHPHGPRAPASDPWLLHTLESGLRMERRVTVVEMKTENHAGRISALEADARMVREAILRLLRGCLALMLGLALDQQLNAGALLAALRSLLAH